MKGNKRVGVVKSRVTRIESENSWEYFMVQPNLVVVHFAAYWCMPSVAMNPCFEKLALGYQGAVFLSVDVDEMKALASKMEVKAMPTFLLMKNGAVVDKMVGANPDKIREKIGGFF